MLQLAHGFAVAFLGFFLNFDATHTSLQDPPQTPPIRWACRPLTYLQPPRVENSVLKTRLMTTCDFDAVRGGGFVHLRAYLNQRIVREARTVHSGPDSVMYKDDPAQKYDLTTRVGNATDYSDVRQNVFIGTNETSHLNFDSFSTRITGVGNGQYLKKTDIVAKVTSTSVARKYGTRLEATVQIQKPWFIPTNIFIDQVQRSIEQNTERVERELMTELANNL